MYIRIQNASAAYVTCMCMVIIVMLKGMYIFSAKNPDESELDEALNNVVSYILLI